MQIHELLREAWDETEKAKLPEHIHEVAFTHAVAMLNGTPPTRSVPTPTPIGPASSTPPDSSLSTPSSTPSEPVERSTDDLFDELASETGVDRNRLESVFYFHDGKPGISLRVHKLGRNKAEQTRSVALLVFCAHYFALNENEVSIEIIRTACEELKCYDSANFSSMLSKIEGANYTGPRGKKVLRFRPDTIEKFQQKVNSILNEEA